MTTTLDPVSAPGPGISERQYLEYMAQWLSQARTQIINALITGNAITGVDISGTVPDLLQVDGLKSLPLPTPVASEFFQVNAGATGINSVGFGSLAGAICEGDDARLSDSRAPTGAAGGDLSGTYPDPTIDETQFKLDDLGAPDDNTDLNASASAHGLLPKLSGVSTQYLNGAGAFGTINLDGMQWLGGSGAILAGGWADEALSSIFGASVSTTGLVPAGALDVIIVLKVTADITGATSFDAGDGTDVDLFGAGLGLATGTEAGPTTYTAVIARYDYVAAGMDVTLTANGANFTDGTVHISAFYYVATAS